MQYFLINDKKRLIAWYVERIQTCLNALREEEVRNAKGKRI